MNLKRKKFIKSLVGYLLVLAVVLTTIPMSPTKAASEQSGNGSVLMEAVTYEVFTANDVVLSESNEVISTSLHENWDANVVASDNIAMQSAAGWFGTNGYTASNHDSRNAIYSVDKEKVGTIVFQVPVEESATITKLIVNGRSCAGSQATVSISSAQDGTYTDLYTIEEAKSGTDVELDVSVMAADWTDMYVKVTFPVTMCQDWAAFWNIRAEGMKEKPAEVITDTVTIDVFTANDVVLSESNEVISSSLHEGWDANVVATDNVAMQSAAGWFGTNGYTASNHDARNAIYSVDKEKVGTIVFQVPMDEVNAITKLIVNGRSCAGSQATVSISSAKDGTYTDLYTIEEAKSGTDVELDVSAMAADWTDMYVKVTFPVTMCQDWAAFWNIRAEGVKEKPSAVVKDKVTVDVFTANDVVLSESNEVISTSLHEGWDANVVATDNVAMQSAAGWFGTNGHTASNHDARNAIYSVDKEKVGTIVFQVPMDEVNAITKLIVNGRSCAGSQATVSISSAQDGTYADLYTIEEAKSGTDVELDVSAITAGWTEVYVKVTFPKTMCQDWAAFWNIRAEGTKDRLVELVTVDASYEVFRANDVVLSESNEVTGTSLNANWNANVVASDNVEMQQSAGWFGTNGYTASNHDTRNAIYSVDKDKVGTIVFKVPAEENATITALVVNGRSCAGSQATVSISSEQDGTYTDLYTIEEAKSGTDVKLDITARVADWENIFVKVSFPKTMCQDWAAFWNIRAEGTKQVVKEEEKDDEVIVVPNPTDQTDSAVVTWEIGSEDNYNLTSDGLTRTTVVAEAGTVADSYNVAILEAGKSMSFVLPEAIGLDTNLTMEIREIHMHGDSDIAYTIALNGTSIQERTITPQAEGATHVWADFSNALLDKENDNEVTITNIGAQAIRFESIWFYENLDALLVEEDIYRPMEFVIFTIPVGYKDYAADLAVVNEYKANYSGYEKYTVGMAFDIFYMNWEMKTLQTRIDWLMQLSADSGMPLYLDLNSWWSGTSNGMDGMGGFWKDITNQQIIYDPDNVNGQGEWQLTTPNMWGSTPWLSLNNEWYNFIRNLRLAEISDYISMKQAEYAAEGNEIDVNIFMENEPIYWAYKHYNSTTTDGRADLSYLVIQSALDQGLVLDPTDGLSGEEQLWLFRNLADYMEAEGQHVTGGLGNDPVRIVDGTVTYPTTQMIEKSFSHMPVKNTNESTTIDGVYYPFWEWHVVDSLRIGLEYASTSEIDSAGLTYVTARGTWADVNIERTAISNFKVLNQLYENGADYAILFNVAKGDYPLVKAMDAALADIPESVQKRSRSLWISARADVERLLGDLEGTITNSGAAAEFALSKDAYAKGRYGTAYNLLMKVQSTSTLPMDFTVAGNGKLLDFPITVTTDGSAVNVTLYEAGTEVLLQLTSENAENVMVTWHGVYAYTVEDMGDGLYLLTKGGNVTGVADLISAPYYSKDYPDEIEGVYISNSNGYISISSQDGEVSEYVNSVDIKLAEDCVITREADGDESTRKTVTIEDLKKYDALTMTLNENDEVTLIQAVYGETIGRVVSVTYPVVNGLEGLDNAYITIKEVDGTIREFELCSITEFDYPTKTGNNVAASDLTDYGLAEGDKIRISYTPYDMGDGNITALKVYKIDYTTNVLNINFEDGTLQEYYQAENVYVTRLDSNYANKVATAQNKEELGILIWKVEQENDMPIGEMTIEFACRSILGTSLNLYMSDDDGVTWTKIGQNELDGSFQSIQTIAVEDIEANTVLVKVEMDSIGAGDPDTWSSLDQISIKIPSADMVAAGEVDEMILAIGTVTEESGEAIEAAREAYEALTDAQKEIVENEDILAEAEKTYEALMSGDTGEGGAAGDGELGEGNSPTTGHSSMTMLWVAIMVINAGAFGMIYLARKSRKYMTR